MSVSGISWAISKSVPRPRQVTMPASHHSVFYRPDALPAAQPTASNHWRHNKDDTTSPNIYRFQNSFTGTLSRNFAIKL